MDGIMESEEGLKVDSPNRTEAETSSSKTPEEEVKTEYVRKEEKKKTDEKKKKEEDDEKTKTVPFHKLFAFADSFDIILMILGTIGAVGNGLGFPIMTILFGDVIDVFGQNQNSTDVSDKIAKVALKFVYLGLGTLVAALLQVSGWMISGERQAGRIRSLYLKTILRQDIAFFDVETNTGEVVGRMSGDTVLIQDAMGEKVGKAIQLISTFIGGFVIAFAEGWLLTLVMVSSIPLLVMSGAALAIVISKMASRGQTSYAKAAVVVEQTVGSIRTVASFTGEKQAISSYNKHLVSAYRAGVFEGASTGIGLGTLNIVIFCTYALAVWYGGKMILEKGYTGGQVLVIIFAVGKAIQLISTFIGGFVIAFAEGWLLTLVMVSSIPLLVMSGAALAIVISKMASRGQTSYAKAAVVVEQTVGSIRTVASFTGEKQAISSYNKHLVSAYRAGVFEGASTGIGLGTLNIVIFCTYALAVWYGGKMILEKGYTGGQVLVIIFAVLTGSMSLGQASPCLSAFAAGQAAAYKMFETIKRKPEIDASDTAGKVLDDVRGDIELRDVDFSYPARPEEQIFRGFSLSISSGSTVALVGQSGSGKSTVVSLIERFYDPQSGEVRIDGVNLKEFQLKWIRSKIGLVSQEPVLFTSSIKENIAYGKEDATVEEIRKATELANASKFIDKLPQGLDTMVGEHGTQLSGGQKQRIAVARAILKDPRILLLDEATSALDAESERIVQEALDRIMVNRTTVVVAHRLSTRMYEEASQVANDAVGSIRTVASFCAEEKVMKMYKKKCEGPMKTGIRQGIVSGIGFGVSFFVLFASYAASFYAGARLVDDGKTTFDAVFRVFFALTMAAVAISQSSSLSPDSSKASNAAASIFAVIDRESKIDPSDESGRVPDNVKGDIELRHVSFKYPSRPDVQIFQDLCLSIRAGKTIALVGESGSGKSTVIALLQRFYDPDSGQITLDGVEIKTLQLKWLRQQTGLVSQEPVLFNETIRANIAYGKGGDASETEIISAAELSNAHGFISGLQQGYDTMVGERGVQLSGGQKQRVAIARAIVKDPKVLLLDEATSALDAESERVVQDALDRVMVNRTTVVVAHRLSTIKNADVIAVVKNGVIVEKGKHDTLINIKDGVYASLVQLHLSAST
ncbi:hypothetical protein F2Q68_00045235 [Brassica cretica]|uniref:Uncharacterized protein n=1 Tax=Brassica cretica TaxID=69181 RepID=A0A8S9LQ89_BRACR|nr:hypothetical protein F2Q68_00045235 [Brassica cretica]